MSEDKRRGGDLLVIYAARSHEYGHYDRRGQIRERVPTMKRIEARSHWEADTVIGKLGGAVLVPWWNGGPG